MSSKCFTEKEKMLLAELVSGCSIIENKKTDTVTLSTKNAAWIKIRNAFNAQPETQQPRDVRQLRKLWDNLKQKRSSESRYETEKDMRVLKIKMELQRQEEYHNFQMQAAHELHQLQAAKLEVEIKKEQLEKLKD